MTAFLILVGLVILGVWLAGMSGKGRPGAAGKITYVSKQHLLTPAERSFYGVLKSAVGAEHAVMAKVRVADVLAPPKGSNRSAWQRAFNRIAAKHFDFVVCDAGDYRIIAAIELDDRSHGREKRRERDDFLDAAVRSAQLPLLRFNAKRSYSVAEVRKHVLDTVGTARITAEQNEGAAGP